MEWKGALLEIKTVKNRGRQWMGGDGRGEDGRKREGRKWRGPRMYL